MLVERRHAGARVDQEQTRASAERDRRLGLRAHPPGEAVGRRLVEAGGVDRGEVEVAEPRLALAAVAGHAGQVVDERQPPADQPVEQRRLADIRPADDGDLGLAGGHRGPDGRRDRAPAVRLAFGSGSAGGGGAFGATGSASA